MLRYSIALSCMTGLIVALAHCGKSSTAPTVSPPLPPAEEPAADDEGAYASDAGASSKR